MIKYFSIGFYLFVGVYCQGGLETFAGLKVGTSAGGKNYYVSKNIKNDWVNAYSFCYNTNMTMVTLDDLAEANDFLVKIKDNIPNLKGVQYIMVGMTAKPGTARAKWNFYKSGQEVSYAIPFAKRFPDTVANADCLAVEIASGAATYRNFPCFLTQGSFACQA